MWKSVIGYEGLYEVSDKGEIKSLPKIVINNGGKQYLKERIMKQGKHPQGYKLVGLTKNGFVTTHLVHRIVLEAFVGVEDADIVGRHKDNDKTNNLYNLQWGTQHDNLMDRVKHGTAPRGNKHWNCKLTPWQVEQIRVLKGVKSAVELGFIYKIHPNTVYKLWDNSRWIKEAV